MEVREPIYSFEIARRSVGRAAFHLGIDSMSEGALDVLADILLNYLNRIGRTLSHLVEASGRTSAHANILDALQACELVASPAVERLHLRDDDDLFATAAASTTKTSLSSDWQGLAAFLFGPKWLEEKEEDDEAPTSERRQENGAGGKVGPSATDDPSQSKTKKAGWDAPYLDEVLPFPEASEKCANPHPLPPYVGLSLHRAVDQDDDKDEVDADDEQLDQIPDKAFASSWGSILKRKADSVADNESSSTEDVTMADADGATDAQPKKKVKIDDSKATTAQDEGDQRAEDDKRAEAKTQLYVPPFYPPPPVIKTAASQEGRRVVDIPPAPRIEREEAGSRTVRSSLVQLGSYWGSGWDDPSNNNKTDKNLAVPLGRSDPSEQQGTTSLVVPVRSASGSRVSRILEGSLDASAMQ